MNLTQIIADLKELINLEPAKRNFFLLAIGFVLIIGYLYNENQTLKENITNSKKECDVAIAKAQTDYLEQLNLNRKIQQEQINEFIVKSNVERDSIYQAFGTKISVLKAQINNSIKDLNQIKHENIN